MQTQLLAGNPSDQLRVYAVWLPMLWSDGRAMWSGATMPDARVTHYWDGERAVGRWFAQKIDGYDGIAWDSYYLYGPDAVWEDIPTRLVSSGGTIHAERKTLETHIKKLLDTSMDQDGSE